MHKKNKISKNIYERIRSTGGNIPKLYGTAKVHKQNVPLRPVISMPGSIYDNLGKWLYDQVKHMQDIKPNINSIDICRLVTNERLGEDVEWFSADVVALFTNVPLEEAIEVMVEELYRLEDEQHPVTKETFKALLLLATRNITFTAPDGSEWNQVDGCAMGSQLGPALANIWMAKKIDGKVKEELENGLYYRYVDDTLATAKKADMPAILHNLNKIHEKLQFTMETLDDNKELAFLDIKLRLEGNRTTTTQVYTKSSSTDVVMNYLANAPWQHKKAAAVALIRRAIQIPSNQHHRNEAMKNTKNVLSMNQWPDKVVKKLIQQEERKIQNDNSYRTGEPNEETRPTLTLPWVDNRTQDAIQKIERIANLKDIKIRTAVQTEKLRTVCNNKAQTSKMLTSNVVYELVCPDCEGRYVGQTTRHLIQRMKEHERGNTAIRSHGCTKVDTDSVKILYKGRTAFRTKVAEAVFIKTRKPLLNDRDENTYQLAIKLL